MALANILVGLHRAKLACPQLRADFANGFSLRCALGKLNEQAIRELVICFVAVDVGCDHFDRTCLVKCLHEFCRVILVLETSERTRSLVVGLFRQPFVRLAAIWFLQERTHRDFQNVFLCRAIFRQQLRWLASKLRQRFIFGRRLTICTRTDDLAAKPESFRKQCPIAQPHSVSSTELTAYGRDFELELSVVIPLALDTGAVNHFVFAEQASRFVPLTANAVEQSVFEWFFGGAFAVLVPGTDNTVPVAIPYGNLVTKLSVSIKCFLDCGAHVSHIRFYSTPHLPPSFNTHRSEKPTKSCLLLAEKRRGANSTRSHEWHHEAPLREARQAAPDGARASAALSSCESSWFSRGTKPLRRKGYGFIVMSYSAANSIAENIFNKFPLRLQPSRRPATIPRDENLEANSRRRRKAQGGTEATTRSILELSAAAISSPLVFIVVTATSRMARQANCNPVKINECRKSL